MIVGPFLPTGSRTRNHRLEACATKTELSRVCFARHMLREDPVHNVPVEVLSDGDHGPYT